MFEEEKRRIIACIDQSIDKRYDVDCREQCVVRSTNAFNALSWLDIVYPIEGRNKCVKCVADRGHGRRRHHHHPRQNRYNRECHLDIDNIIIIRSIGHTKNALRYIHNVFSRTRATTTTTKHMMSRSQSIDTMA